MRYVYSAILYLLLPLTLVRMLFRSIKVPDYRRRLAERFGWFSVPEQSIERPVLWVHAVSLGEVQAAAPLVRALLNDYPDYRVVLTTTTPAGSQQVRRLFGDSVFHIYLPWDLPGAIQRFHEPLNPRVLILLETELWPNLITLSARFGCRCLLVNARLSQRSARRYGYVEFFTAQVINQLQHVLCQSAADAQRFARLGVSPQKLSVGGSLKYETVRSARLQQAAQAVSSLLAVTGRPVILAASTHAGEEDVLLQAFAQIRSKIPDSLLVIAPRRAERFAAVAELCDAQTMAFTRWTSQIAVPAEHPVLLVDTLGELAPFFGVASVAFIGGSLVRHGGHNPLEAALWGVPVIAGKHVHNFDDVYARLRARDAVAVVHSADELAEVVTSLLLDDAVRQQMGQAGEQVLAENRGALQATLQLLEQTLRD